MKWNNMQTLICMILLVQKLALQPLMCGVGLKTKIFDIFHLNFSFELHALQLWSCYTLL